MRPAIRRDVLDGAIAAAVLLALLALSDWPPIRAGFDALALGLAALAAPLLDLIGLPVVRTAAELRGVSGNWAVVVTEVCDGHGLVAAWLGLTAALSRDLATALRMGLLGLVAIQAFNLLRVLMLAAVLSGGPERFDTVHLFLFPLLTTALFALLLRPAGLVGVRTMAMVLGIGAAIAALWVFAAGPVSGVLLVPPANLLLSLLEPAGIDGVAPTGEGWAVATTRLASLDPPSFLRAPIHPEDFAIALPALLGAALALRGGVGGMALGLALMIGALALGAVTAGWGLSGTGTPGQVVEIASDGTVSVIPYRPPGDVVQGLVRLAQNGAVHFNLLVLPLLILARRPAR